MSEEETGLITIEIKDDYTVERIYHFKELKQSIIKNNIYTFKLCIYVDNNCILETSHHLKKEIEYEVKKERIQKMIQTYNEEEDNEMCFMDDLTSQTILENYISNDSEYFRNIIFETLLNSNGIIIHDKDYKIVAMLNDKDSYCEFKNDKKYLESIRNIITGNCEALKFKKVVTFDVLKKDDVFYLDNELATTNVLRGNIIKFELEPDQYFELYDENLNVIECIKNNNSLILKTDYQTPKRIYYNKNNKHHYLKLNNGISELFEKLFNCVIKDNKSDKINDYVIKIAFFIILEMNIENEDFTFDLMEELSSIASGEEKAYRIIDMIEFICNRTESTLLSNTINQIVTHINKKEFELFEEKKLSFCSLWRKGFNFDHHNINIEASFSQVTQEFTNFEYESLSKNNMLKFKELFYTFCVIKKEFWIYIDTCKEELDHIQDSSLNDYLIELKRIMIVNLWSSIITKEIYAQRMGIVDHLYEICNQVEIHLHQLMDELICMEEKGHQVHSLHHLNKRVQHIYKKTKDVKMKKLLEDIYNDNSDEKIDELFEIENQMYEKISPLQLLNLLNFYCNYYDDIRYQCISNVVETLYESGIENSLYYSKVFFYLENVKEYSQFKKSKYEKLSTRKFELLKTTINTIKLLKTVDYMNHDFIDDLITEGFHHMNDLKCEGSNIITPIELISNIRKYHDSIILYDKDLKFHELNTEDWCYIQVK